MKYLEKSFSIYPSVRHVSEITRGKKKRIDPKHEYSDIGGMCRHCALDRKGHELKFGK